MTARPLPSSARRMAVLITALTALLLAACSDAGTPPDSPTGGADLASSAWRLTDLGPSADPSPVAGEITLAFAESDISGFGGVNRFFGPYTATADGKLDIGPLGSTLMAGEPAAMQTETDFLQTLQAVTGYAVAGGELTMFRESKPVLRFAAD